MARQRVALLFVAICALSSTALGNGPTTDKLVAAIEKKKMATVMEELSVAGLDVNTPDSSKRLPLVEAVRSKDQKAVQALLEQGALANVHDPASGTTPLHLAFLADLAAIARNLLAHGANPNVTDKAGAMARSVSNHDEVQELVAAYDAKGAMAFEAAPGSWLKEVKDGNTYYWSPATGESRWTPPPSCAWRRVLVQGHPMKYINTVTGQEVTSTPPALAWAKVRSAEGEELWLNWATQTTTATLPAELPAEMAEALAGAVNQRWYNAATKEYRYVDPLYSTAWRELHDEATDRLYWYNIESGETAWEMPEELAWERQEDSEAGATYYFNKYSGEVSWQTPTSGPLAYTRVEDL